MIISQMNLAEKLKEVSLFRINNCTLSEELCEREVVL